MATDHISPKRYVEAIRQRRLSIYDTIQVGDPELWIPTPALQQLLDAALAGVSLAGLPIRTRSKVAKEYVCRALGYQVPPSFKKTQPRFLGQLFDTYVQKSNNLQVWNEQLDATRRYVIIRVGKDDVIASVRVVTGAELALLDSTGTLTQKYQARLSQRVSMAFFIDEEDTELLRAFTQEGVDLAAVASPLNYPRAFELLPIREIYERLQLLVGEVFSDIGYDQERNRGASLHRLVCRQLGYNEYHDDGQFPDVRHQLLEVKLQTSPTIDLGLVRPDSEDALDVPKIQGRQIRHCDVRYAVFYAESDGRNVTLRNLILSSGKSFFAKFRLFRGRVLNKKLQIPLPTHFFTKSGQ